MWQEGKIHTYKEELRAAPLVPICEGKKGFGKTGTSGSVDMEGEEIFQPGEGVKHVTYREVYKAPSLVLLTHL